MTRRLGSNYSEGVPTPYVAHVHPYPTRFHGGIWTRPVFGMPQMQTPTTVFLPPRDIDMQPDQPYTGNPFAGALGRGLGDLQYDVGEGIFRPGGYGGGVFDGNLSGAPALGKRGRGVSGMGSLGDAASDAVDYPWGKVSDKTKALQQATNTELAKLGYCPIAVDGKLGPATCGARNRVNIESPDEQYANPSTCTSFTTPSKLSTGCGSGSGSSSALVNTTQQSSLTSSGSSLPLLSSNTKKALGFVAGGLAAVGVVYLIKKHRSARR